ncbi:MAG: TetR/AcrR family transcriptional regulator [Bacteroidia bacterium]|nr:TetR/AcrR family transcriptional regulator [Bacteroidia bacterium]
MTKERILHGAQELFFRNGIRSVTMDDIANHLGMSKKTIYQSFSDKDEIVTALMEAKLTWDKQEICTICSPDRNMIEQVFGIMRHMTEMFSRMNPSVFYDLQKYHPKAWKIFTDFKNSFMLGVIEKNIEDGKAEGTVRPDVNTHIMARMRIEQVEMGFNPAVFPPCKHSLLEIQVALLEHFLYGICTLKGHKLINKYKQVAEDE